MKTIRHRLAHLFGIFYGQCYSWWDGDKLMMGFKCSTCGDISGVHDATHIANETTTQEK